MKACNRQRNNTVEKGAVIRKADENTTRAQADREYWMSSDNVQVKNEEVWRRWANSTETMLHVYTDGSVKYAREEGGGKPT